MSVGLEIKVKTAKSFKGLKYRFVNLLLNM